MGRQSTDILIKSFFEKSIQDLRKNKWLLADVFGVSIQSDPLIKQEYRREKDNAIEWFLNEDISVLQVLRKDLPKFPCISIELVSSTEDTRQASLGDTAIETLGMVDPEVIDKAPTKTYDFFTPVGYNPVTGVVTMPANLNTYQLAPSIHMLVEKNTGRGFVIKSCIDDQNFGIEPETQLDIKDVYIAPVLDAYNVHYGRSRFNESYEIGVHASSEPYHTIWLNQLVEYILLKYKNKYLDDRNVVLSTFSASTLNRRKEFSGDNIFSRYFTMNLQTEMSWVENVYPRIGRVAGGIYIADAPASPESLIALKESVRTEGDRENGN